MARSRPRQKPTAKKPHKRPAPRMLPRARVAAAVQTMAATSGTDRFSAGKALCVTAKKDPSRVYPHFDAIAALLRSDCKIVCWNAIQILGLLAPVDTERKVDAVLETYLAFIRGHDLISAANVIGGASQIARSRPDLIGRIVPAILEVERATYKTPECRSVAIGQALDAFAELGPGVCRRPDVVEFVNRQKTNTRAAVARRASQLAAL